jgi:hypothetical protein|tara:strand:- start:393 stop:512 length:120 start_codon:yes stop_codon:yes gene_type:complete
MAQELKELIHAALTRYVFVFRVSGATTLRRIEHVKEDAY